MKSSQTKETFSQQNQNQGHGRFSEKSTNSNDLISDHLICMYQQRTGACVTEICSVETFPSSGKTQFASELATVPVKSRKQDMHYADHT